MTPASPTQMSAQIKLLARESGFDLVGIARVEPSRYEREYRDWVAAGKHGEMHYLEKGVEERMDLRKKFAWAKSVVCVGMAYSQVEPKAQGLPPPQSLGLIARYTQGRDYHKVMGGKLKQLEASMRQSLGELQVRTYCDTGPILERELANLAGLGWVGKNTLLIHRQHGSYFVLGEMVLDLELEADLPELNHCGTCRRCAEACPTGAIEGGGYSVDARRCISYLTLEHRGAIAEEFLPAMREAGYVAGCDICQEVCPFNRAHPPAEPGASVEEILAWNEADWDRSTRGRAFRRAKLHMWQRNARIVQSSSTRRGAP